MRDLIRYTLPFLLLASSCAGTAERDPLLGNWGMVSHMQDTAVEATMTLERDAAGALVGNWNSRGSDMELSAIVVDGEAIEFEREIPGGQVLHFAGNVHEGEIEGSWSGPFGDMPVEGQKLEDNQVAESESSGFHERPIIEENGQTLLWANDEEWFDVTESKIDPTTFQYGIGKDTIPSIDEPVFVAFADPRVEAAEISLETPVLGIVLEGEARAYPVSLMDGHEIVNDRFGEKAFAVLL